MSYEASPLPQSSGAEEHGETSGINESAQPSAPAWTGTETEVRGTVYVCVNGKERKWVTEQGMKYGGLP